MRYAHVFWKLFGLPVDRWDELPLADLAWMKPVADDWSRQQKESAGG